MRLGLPLHGCDLFLQGGQDGRLDAHGGRQLAVRMMSVSSIRTVIYEPLIERRR
jgi:hypothetical protein